MAEETSLLPFLDQAVDEGVGPEKYRDQDGCDKEKLLKELQERLDESCIDFECDNSEDFYDSIAVCDEELMDKYISEKGIDTKPYAEYLLKYLKDNGYKTAIATATALERTEKYLKQVGLYKYFDKIICASMVKKGKPEPDIYLKAAESLELMPCECIALEDSKNGIISASSAGCKTVMVPDLDGPDEEILSMTYSVAANLKEVINLLNK